MARLVEERPTVDDVDAGACKHLSDDADAVNGEAADLGCRGSAVAVR